MTLYKGWPEERERAKIKRDAAMRSVPCNRLASQWPCRRPTTVMEFCHSSRKPTVQQLAARHRFCTHRPTRPVASH